MRGGGRGRGQRGAGRGAGRGRRRSRSARGQPAEPQDPAVSEAAPRRARRAWASAATSVYILHPLRGTAVASSRPPLSWSDGSNHYATVTPAGDVLVRRKNDAGQPGSADHAPRDKHCLVRCRLPRPAALVRCGCKFTVAVSRGGAAVWSWGEAGARLGRPGAGSAPGAVAGLPAADPVVLLETGMHYVIAITASGEAYGWGYCYFSQIALGRICGKEPAPVRIAALSGRGVCRLACAWTFAAAETRDGALLWWGSLPEESAQKGPAPHFVVEPQPVPVQAGGGRLAFPLRSLTASLVGCAAVDAAGCLWCMWAGEVALSLVQLPARAVHAACCNAHNLKHGLRQRELYLLAYSVAVLTADGELWDCRKGAPCRSISAAHPELPLGLWPSGRWHSHCTLIPDCSCGPSRCRIFLLTAGRRELLPGGGMGRIALIPFLVEEGYIFDGLPEATPVRIRRRSPPPEPWRRPPAMAARLGSQTAAARSACRRHAAALDARYG